MGLSSNLALLTCCHALHREFLPYPGSRLVEQFLCICRQITDHIELKFGGASQYVPPTSNLLDFGTHSTEIPLFLGLWPPGIPQPASDLVTLRWIPAICCPVIGWAFPHICRQTSDWIELKLGRLPYFRSSLINFGHAPTVSWPLIGWRVSMHLQTNCSLDSAQIWWVNSLCASPSLTKFLLHSAEIPVFPGLWVVEQFLCICRQTPDRNEPDCTKPLPEQILTYHQWSPVTITWGQFHMRQLSDQLMILAWKLLN